MGFRIPTTKKSFLKVIQAYLVLEVLEMLEALSKQALPSSVANIIMIDMSPETLRISHFEATPCTTLDLVPSCNLVLRAVSAEIVSK